MNFKKIYIKGDKKSGIIYFIFSVLFALSITIGNRIYKDNRTDFHGAGDIVLFVLLTLLAGIGIYFIIWGIGKLCDLLKNKLQEKIEKTTIGMYLLLPFKIRNRWILLVIFSLIIFIFWLPCFLSYYPMVNSYDLFYTTPYWFSQTSQAMTGEFINHHPVIHTFFWRLAIKTGETMELSPFVPYAIGQMLVMSVFFAKTLVYMCQKRMSRLVCILTLVFYIIPVNAIFVQIPVKDVSLAAVLILFILNLYRLLKKDDGYKLVIGCVVAVIEGLLCCLLRQNFIYAFVVFAFLALLLEKKSRKYIVVISLTTVIFYYLINGPIFKAVGVKPGEKHEALSVPIQQMAYVMNSASDKLSEDNIFEIKAYMPAYEDYNPRYADPVKDKMDDHLLESNFKNFVKLWVKVGLKCPQEYIDSFLTLNIPYWYIGADPIDPYSGRVYIETGNHEDHTPLISESFLNFYEKEGDFDGIDSLPIIKYIFILAFPLWLLLFGITHTMANKNLSEMTVMLLLLLFILTFLLGPVSNMRYIYPIFVCYPIIIFVLIFNNRTNKVN